MRNGKTLNPINTHGKTVCSNELQSELRVTNDEEKVEVSERLVLSGKTAGCSYPISVTPEAVQGLCNNALNTTNNGLD